MNALQAAASQLYSFGLEKNAANFAQLTPLTYLARSATVFPDRVAIIHGDRRITWAQTYERCRRLASALRRRGVGHGTTVAVLVPNTPAMVEAHFGVPMAGAVLNTLNIRLDAEAIAFQLTHGEARVLLVDREFGKLAARALDLLEPARRPFVISIDDAEAPQDVPLFGEIEYEALLAEGDPAFVWAPPADEWDAIALNYTSGTTGNPKGVVYHHRGAALNAVNNLTVWGMPRHSVYLWTLPMFHCNGWCFPWTVAANAGVNVCLRRVEAGRILELIRAHGVTHFCGAPVVYSMIVNAPPEMQQGSTHKVQGLVAGAAPPATVIEGMERLGFEITHVFGLTETYGPAASCEKQEAWKDKPLAERAVLNARQGVTGLLQERMEVLDPETLEPVPHDGETIGEIMFRGNITMKGYLKNPTATEEAFAGGWFHSGDLAVVEPDGYVRIKDRSKDVIISGGENISSIEVEDVLHRHPAVEAAAVVAKPDERWGEVPCAFVQIKPDAEATVEEIRTFCQEHMARYKVPKLVVFGTIPRTSTGKVQKYMLRKMAQDAKEITS
ncbi:MAG TPA: acyl-CoA synthetase [Acetobacteraceae bacterium]|nr:acyl-CoA synthetase [Acetobacteraceae bacterium]